MQSDSHAVIVFTVFTTVVNGLFFSVGVPALSYAQGTHFLFTATYWNFNEVLLLGKEMLSIYFCIEVSLRWKIAGYKKWKNMSIG